MSARAELLRGDRLRAAAHALLASGPAGLLTDLDGTLSPIAARPELATVPPGIRRALRRLVRQLALVAVVTGRPADAARRLLRVRGVLIVGSHGLHAVVDRRRWTHPEATRYQPAAAAVLAIISSRLAGHAIQVEPKTFGAAIHYRGAANPEAARAAILSALSALPEAAPLRLMEGRRVIELRPSIDASKGTAVHCLLRRCRLRAALFLGDDRTDLDAMRALRDARARGLLRALTVAVASTEMPPELLDAADGLLDGVEETEALLTALATSLPPAPSPSQAIGGPGGDVGWTRA